MWFCEENAPSCDAKTPGVYFSDRVVIYNVTSKATIDFYSDIMSGNGIVFIPAGAVFLKEAANLVYMTSPDVEDPPGNPVGTIGPGLASDADTVTPPYLPCAASDCIILQNGTCNPVPYTVGPVPEPAEMLPLLSVACALLVFLRKKTRQLDKS